MDIYLTDIYIFILIYFYITSDLFKDIWLIAQKYFTEVGQDQKKKKLAASGLKNQAFLYFNHVIRP